MSNSDCPVCALPFTSVRRYEVRCNLCKESACFSCVKRYLLETSTACEACCMHCRGSWEFSKYELLRGNFVHDQLRNVLANRALQEEFARGSERAAQLESHRRFQTHDLIDNHLQSINTIVRLASAMTSAFVRNSPERITALQRGEAQFIEFMLRSFQDFTYVYSPRNALYKLSLVAENVQRSYAAAVESARTLCAALLARPGEIDVERVDDAARQTVEAIVECTQALPEHNTDARGFPHGKGTSGRSVKILCARQGCGGWCTNDGACLRCTTATCVRCRECREDGHVCSAEALESVQMIEKNSTQCPGCGHFVSKKDGCDLGWCTICHTHFSFKTGEAKRGGHNPEFEAWLKTTRPLDRRAEDENAPLPINAIERNHYITTCDFLSREQKAVLTSFHNATVHLCDLDDFDEDAESKVYPSADAFWREIGFSHLRDPGDDAYLFTLVKRHVKRNSRLRLTNYHFLGPLREKIFSAIEGVLTRRLSFPLAVSLMKDAAREHRAHVETVSRQWRTAISVVHFDAEDADEDAPRARLRQINIR